MYKVNDGGKVKYDENIGAFKYVVQVYYDPAGKKLVVEDIDTKGGRIYPDRAYFQYRKRQDPGGQRRSGHLCYEQDGPGHAGRQGAE